MIWLFIAASISVMWKIYSVTKARKRKMIENSSKHNKDIFEMARYCNKSLTLSNPAVIAIPKRGFDKFISSYKLEPVISLGKEYEYDFLALKPPGIWNILAVDDVEPIYQSRAAEIVSKFFGYSIIFFQSTTSMVSCISMYINGSRRYQVSFMEDELSIDGAIPVGDQKIIDEMVSENCQFEIPEKLFSNTTKLILGDFESWEKVELRKLDTTKSTTEK